MSKKTWIIIGVVGGFLLLSRQSAAAPGRPAKAGGPVPKMAAVGQNEKVSATTYQMLQKRRGGYFYTPAKLLKEGGIEFVSPVSGFFTRYAVKDATGRIFAEILKAA